MQLLLLPDQISDNDNLINLFQLICRICIFALTILLISNQRSAIFNYFLSGFSIISLYRGYIVISAVRSRFAQLKGRDEKQIRTRGKQIARGHDCDCFPQDGRQMLSVSIRRKHESGHVTRSRELSSKPSCRNSLT